MKILWIVNTIFPAPSKFLGLPIPAFGGWMYGLVEQLKNTTDLNLAIATTYSGSEIKIVNIDDIEYYLLPSKNKLKYNIDLEQQWIKLIEQFQPDIVHIHGTEYAHGLACMRTLPDLKYVVSIQGLLSVISRYYYEGMSFSDIFWNITFRDLMRWDTLFHQKQNFKRRGQLEKEYIVRTKNIIGRTSWDYAHVKTINSNVDYYFCNDLLRNSFYENVKWSLDSCEKQSIFLSQAGYPVKGLHQVLKAIKLLKSDFPKIKVKIAGDNIIKSTTFSQKIRLSGYGKYIRRFIEKNLLIDNVVFLGVLDEVKMRDEYLSSHVFISPSTIENGGNSVGEAQLLGVPVIASYVGGIPDSIEQGESGLLYRFEEIEMLAQHIRSIFLENDLTLKLSNNGFKAANLRHDRGINMNELLSIYSKIN